MFLYKYDACFKFRVLYIEGFRGRGTEEKIGSKGEEVTRECGKFRNESLLDL